MMDDLEMTKLCAEAMGISTDRVRSGITLPWQCFDPLHDDAQAMALVKRFPVECILELNDLVSRTASDEEHLIAPAINRAIVECVAKMRATAPDTRSHPQEPVEAK